MINLYLGSPSSLTSSMACSMPFRCTIRGRLKNHDILWIQSDGCPEIMGAFLINFRFFFKIQDIGNDRRRDAGAQRQFFLSR